MARRRIMRRENEADGHGIEATKVAQCAPITSSTVDRGLVLSTSLPEGTLSSPPLARSGLRHKPECLFVAGSVSRRQRRTAAIRPGRAASSTTQAAAVPHGSRLCDDARSARGTKRAPGGVLGFNGETGDRKWCPLERLDVAAQLDLPAPGAGRLRECGHVRLGN